MDDLKQKRLLLWTFLAAVLIVLSVAGLIFFRDGRKGRARVEERFPLQRLDYCSPEPVTPCIVSFSQDAEGNMLVSFLTAGAFYPDFYLKVKADETDHIYVCQKANTFATSVYCTGAALPLGEVLQFYVISLNGDVVLAQGNFPIIGIALAGPVVFSPTSVLTPVTPTDVFLNPEVTPSPSYPSYPGAGP